MGPAIVEQVQADAAFRDPAQRAQFRLQHEQGVPLIDMLEAIAPTGGISPQLRAAITGLRPDEVAIIRKVMTAAIDQAGTSTDTTMPIDCQIAQVAGAVAIGERQDLDRAVAVVTPRA